MSMVTMWESGVYHLLPTTHVYILAPHNDDSTNDGSHIRRWSHNITI